MYLFDTTNHSLSTLNLCEEPWHVRSINVVKLIQLRLYIYVLKELYSPRTGTLYSYIPASRGTFSWIESTETRHFIDMVSVFIVFFLTVAMIFFGNNVWEQGSLMLCERKCVWFTAKNYWHQKSIQIYYYQAWTMVCKGCNW